MSIGKIFLQNEPFLHSFLTPYLRRIPQVCGLNRALKITTGPFHQNLCINRLIPKVYVSESNFFHMIFFMEIV